MFKDQVRAIINAGESHIYDFFEWFHDACDTSELPTTERHYILTRLGIDHESYEDWLEEGDWE